MDIQVTWDDSAHTILIWSIHGLWEWDDIYAAAERSALLRQSVDHPVSVIIDVSEAAPLRPDTLRHTRRALGLNPEGREMVVIVGSSHFVESIVEIFRKMNLTLADHVQHTPTVEQARRLIAQRRSEG
jgi:hypothetical protein